jgi:hypothetical protein
MTERNALGISATTERRFTVKSASRWSLDDHGNAAGAPNYDRAVGPILSRVTWCHDGCDPLRTETRAHAVSRPGRALHGQNHNNADRPRTGLLLSRAIATGKKRPVPAPALDRRARCARVCRESYSHAGDRRCSGRRHPCTTLSIACVTPCCSCLPIACSCGSRGG